MNILVLYYYLRYPPRGTNLDHLYSFGRYSGHRVSYINLAVREVPEYAKRFKWDLIVFHDLFVCSRWTRDLFERNVEKVRCFENTGTPKIVIPQDEFINMDQVCGLINDFGISRVYSVSPPSEWPKQYRTVDQSKMRKVLTGYIDEGVKGRIKQLSKEVTDRPIDLGYRSHHVPYWLGRHAQLKWQIGEAFKDKGLKTDISVEDSDVITGDEWYRFLLSCKYQLGIEGGASILDWDGTYQSRTDAYLQDHPDASFSEVERECFPGAEGSLKLFALSPRHFECCLTKTCQVLIEGEYDGVLKPWVHYIPVKKDLSNVDRVIAEIKKDQLREGIVERAWKDIVEPGLYTYERFVKQVLSGFPESKSLRGWVIHKRLALADQLSWLLVQAHYNPEIKRWYKQLRRVSKRI